jgi:hypothetical protein
MTQPFTLATRPTRSNNAHIDNPGQGLEKRPIQLLANYYAFKFTNPKLQNVFKYTVKFEPEIPDNSTRMRKKLVSLNRALLKEKYLNFFIFLGGTCIYSLENCPDIPELEAEIDGVTFKIKIEWV